MGVKELDHARQVRQVFGCAGGDHAPRAVAAQLFHRAQHLVVHALAAPGSARRVGNAGHRAIKREADADVARGQEIERRIVEQRSVGLQAEDEIVGESVDGREDGRCLFISGSAP
jgi:hypothetical protein